MKMNPETWKLYKLAYSLVLLWCYMIKPNGGSDTNVEPLMVVNNNSNTQSIQNESGNNPWNSIFSMNISNGSIKMNIPYSIPGSNANQTQCKTPIKNVRDDYTLAEGIGYHKLQMRKLNWNNARKACMEENAHLVVVNSIKEADLLSQLMNVNEDVRSAYVGAHDMFLEGEWITVNGESLEKAGFNVWAPSEPNNAEGNEHCAVLRKVGEMNDIPCSFEWYYICEISL